MVGKEIRHYKVLEELGRGGMGVVYKAKDIKLDRLVALKFLPPYYGEEDEEKKRFIYEAKATSALDHNNICTIYEIDETEDGQLFLAMAYYDGQTLKEKIAAGPLPEEQCIDLAVQVLKGLLKAHETGIFHRDIKPANVIVTQDGVAKILDFGLAKISGSAGITKTGTSMGTTAYMSPEQAQGLEMDHLTDIWSVGVVLYEMLAGAPPFHAAYEQATIYSIINEDPPPVTEHNPEVSDELDAIVQKALQKEPSERYPSALDFIRALEEFSSPPSKPVMPTAAPQTDSEERSVAVLDFDNISGDSNDDWLSGGIAETVTVDLKKISSLKVMSREKLLAESHRGNGQKITEQEIIELGRALRVRWMVWGGFQKFGQAIRLTAHYTDVASGELVGSAKVDGTMDDIFTLQDKIVSELVSELQLEVSDSEILKLEKPQTLKLEAYEYYAKGKQLFTQFGKESFEQAQALFERALEVDPNYALAYSGLGSVHIFRFIEQTDPRDLDIGIANLEKALKYDTHLVEPYQWLSYAYMRKQKDNEAIEAAGKGLELEPDNFFCYYFMGVAYFSKAATEHQREFFAHAIDDLERSVKLQPNYHPAHLIVGWLHLFHGNYSKAESHLQKAVAIEQSESFEGVKFIGALTLMGKLHALNKDYSQATDWCNKSLEIINESNHFYKVTFTAMTHLIMGTIEFRGGSYDQALNQFKKAAQVILKSPKALGVGPMLVRIRIWQALTFLKLTMTQEEKHHLKEALTTLDKKKGYDFSLMVEGIDANIYYDLACYYALKNRSEDALTYLQKAIECGWTDSKFLQSDDCFLLIRDHLAFQKLIADLKS